MYTRVTTFQIQPAEVEEVMKIARGSITSAIRQQQGFKSFTSLVNRTTGKAMVITVFETEADMRVGLTNGFVQQQFAKIAPFLDGAPTSEFYELDSQG